MSPARDHLVSAFERVREALQAGDADAVAACMNELVALVATAPDVRVDHGVIALFRECEQRAVMMFQELKGVLANQAISTRASAAYGGGR